MPGGAASSYCKTLCTVEISLANPMWQVCDRDTWTRWSVAIRAGFLVGLLPEHAQLAILLGISRPWTR